MPTSSPVAAPSSPSAAEVYRDLLHHGPRARTDLAAGLGLSGPTITRLTREMLDGGLLRELPPVPQAKGRPQQPLEVAEDHARFLGVKITADSVHAAVVTVRGEPLEERSVPLSRPAPELVEATTAELCRELLAAHPRVAGAGVGIGAQVDGAGTVVSSSMLGWSQPVALGPRLEAALGVPVTLGNDFHALLEGLAWSGPSRGLRSIAVVTIGAGVGVGSVQDGQVHRGRRHLAGVTGSLPTITRDGRGLPLRDLASTAHVLEAARARGLDLDPAGGLAPLLAAGAVGDERALDVAADVAHGVAVAGAGLVGVLDPEALVLGGEGVGLLRLDPGFEDTLRSRLSRVMRDVDLRLLPDDFDDWARGAGVLAVRRFIDGADG